jgi:glycosyltransferase involved in cell wall biosynthesis
MEIENSRNSEYFNTQSFPYITVVVPVLNSPQKIKHCLECLLEQSYPKDRYEIIVVDNGSVDNTPQIIRQYPVKLLIEDSIRSPYAARNLGIKSAQGEIIAMTDSDCMPIPQWLEFCVKTLERERADLLGGKVTFTFSPKRTIAEMVDSISNLEMKNNIALKGVAKTGNLMVRKQVFDEIGFFPPHFRSGTDVFWTGRATQAGCKLVYAPNAIVFKPARKLWPLLKKQYRVGLGQPFIWLSQRQNFVQIVGRTLIGFHPVLPAKLQLAVRERGTADMKQRLIAIWLIAWLCNIVTNLGRIHCLFTQTFRSMLISGNKVKG